MVFTTGFYRLKPAGKNPGGKKWQKVAKTNFGQIKAGLASLCHWVVFTGFLPWFKPTGMNYKFIVYAANWHKLAKTYAY